METKSLEKGYAKRLMMSLVERAEGEAEAIQLRDNHHKIRE
jgi:hypothetical protein